MGKEQHKVSALEKCVAISTLLVSSMGNLILEPTPPPLEGWRGGLGSKLGGAWEARVGTLQSRSHRISGGGAK